MVVLNGAEGVGGMLAKALTMGGAGLGLARQLLASMKQETVGEAEQKAVTAADQEPSALTATDNLPPRSAHIDIK